MMRKRVRKENRQTRILNFVHEESPCYATAISQCTRLHRCKKLVFEREKEELDDIELNPELKKACKKDISTYCAKEVGSAKQDHQDGVDPRGRVYVCLKEQMRNTKQVF